MKATELKPCCALFRERAREYQDLAADLDRGARMVANLILSADSEQFDFGQLTEIGYYFENFLNRKLVHEHVFFGRHAGDCTLSDAELSGEIQRVFATIPKSIGGARP